MSKANKIRLAVLLLVLICGAGYPISKIIKFEFPSETPSEYIFRVGAVDPYDPFRGRYVVINAMPTSVKLPTPKYAPEDLKFAVLGKDKDGFGTVVDLTDSPVEGKDCVKLDKQPYGGPASYSFSLPFDKFFMNEKLAPEAEKIIRELSGRNGACTIKVRIYKDGSFSITDLLVEGKPFRKYLEEKQTKEKQKNESAK